MNNLKYEEQNYPESAHTVVEPPEIHYVRADRKERHLGKALLYGTMITVSAALCIFLYLSRTPSDKTIPVIQAEKGPIKIRPEEETAQIPHSEKTIYGELAPADSTPKVENLLAEPEKPQTQTPSLPEEFMKAIGDPEDNATPSSDLAEVTQLAAPAEEMATQSIPLASDKQAMEFTDNPTEESDAFPSALPEEPVAAPVTETSESETAPAPEIAPKEMEVAKIEVKSSKIAPSKNSHNKASVAGKFYRVQIYSAGSQKTAEQQWEKFRKKSGGLLAPYSPVIQRVDLGANIGIRYRLQVGQFTKNAATTFCNSLKKKGIDCWVTR